MMPRKQELPTIEIQENDVSLSWVDLDYVRVTSVRGADLAGLAAEVLSQFYPSDVIKRTAHGFSSNHVKLAYNRQARMLDISGDKSGNIMGDILLHSATVREELAYFTRVDYALDLRMTVPDKIMLTKWYEMSLGNKEVRSRDGETLYFGARTSPVFGRAYDKSLRYGDAPGNVFRFELEGHRVQAKKFAYSWDKAEFKSQHIGQVISGQFLKWGIKLPITGKKMRLEVAVTDEEKTITWLRTTVRPCIARLIEAGRISEVKAALGENVTDYFQAAFNV